MDKIKWEQVKFGPSSLAKIMSRPRGKKKLNDREKAKYSSLILKEELTDKEKIELSELIAIKEFIKYPPLSKTAIDHLIAKYSWVKYNKAKCPYSKNDLYTQKGMEMEPQAIQMVERLTRKKYNRVANFSENDYFFGGCDAIREDKKVVLDVKCNWSICNYVSSQNNGISMAQWMQMQAYIDIYNADYGEVSYVILNTPPHLIQKEKERYDQKYRLGEINSDQYEEALEKIGLIYDYTKIPLRRRVHTVKVFRNEEFIQSAYRKIDLCREWLMEFDKVHVKNKKSVILDNLYEFNTEEDNIEHNPDLSH